MKTLKEKMELLTNEDLKLVDAYIDYLEDWTVKATEKFVDGRINHSDEDFSCLNYEREIENEIFDITAYNFGKIFNS